MRRSRSELKHRFLDSDSIANCKNITNLRLTSPAATRSSAASWLLSLLHLLRLLRVSLLQLLRLLLVLLLHLLRSRWSSILFRQLLMFVVLLLLEFLPFLVLLRDYVFLLLSGISGPASRSPCWEQRGVRRAAAP